jgi:tetratricopeptide (TPR) repeat protein
MDRRPTVTTVTRIAAMAVAVLVVAASPALAQGKWADPYDAGRAAFDKGKWQEAIDDFTKAIAIDPRAQAQKIIEGAFREDYFPYYYRALAYTNVQNYAKAKLDFAQARQTRMSDTLMKDLDKHAGDVDGVLAAQQAPKPPPPQPAAAPAADASKPPVVAPGAPGAPSGASITPAAPDPRAQAAELVKQGNTLLAQGKPTEAQKSFQDAQKLAPQAPGVQEGLGAVANRLKYEQLKSDAAQDRRSGRPADAITKYGLARSADPQQYAADHLDQQLQLAENDLSAVLQRNDASARVLAVANSVNLLNAGRDLARQHRYADADAKFQAAVDADRTNHEAADALAKSQEFEKLVLAGRTFAAQGTLDTARGSLQDAKTLDPDRFQSEGLESTLADVNRRLAPAPAKSVGSAAAPSSAPVAWAPVASASVAPASASAARQPIYDALVAYLEGDMPRSIRLLQPMAANDIALSASDKAAVHAYLAVAYATSSLEARSDADRESWHGKAVGEFKRAEAAKPGYTLSQRVISPKIQAMFDEARRNR